MNYLAAAEAIQDPMVKSVILQIATGYKVMAGHADDFQDHQPVRDGTPQVIEA